MKKIIFILFTLIPLCFSVFSQGGIVDWKQMKLLGKVKSITEIYCSVLPKPKAGEILINCRTKIFTTLFNNKGNRIETVESDAEERLSWKITYKYDNKDNLIEDFELDAGGN